VGTTHNNIPDTGEIFPTMEDFLLLYFPTDLLDLGVLQRP
jgi:hypothetical protein